MFFSGFPKIIGMENFSSLQSLTLMGQQITMLENLECLPNLTELCVSESKLSVSQFLYDTVHCIPPPHLFMGWVFSILVMGSWDSIILALCSRLRSCTIEGLRSKKKASNMLYQRVFDKNSPEFRGILNVIVNFAGFPGFTWISRLHDHAKYQDPWKPLTKMYKLSSLPYSQVQYPWPCSFQLGIMPQLPALVKS